MRRTVCELFAGVGGFHLGLSRSGWNVVWSNQWEPGDNAQWASRCYASHFKETTHVNEDICRVKNQIPNHNLLVGGFPCQDYSVATTKANGIRGKKGVLWWEIFDILTEKKKSGFPVDYIILENVDRLLKSPTSQKGRDFGIILWCLNSLGYSVEWRVINAADYGYPQKRRRVFIFASLIDSVNHHLYSNHETPLIVDGFFAPIFPVRSNGGLREYSLPEDLQAMTENFHAEFLNSGFIMKGSIISLNVTPIFTGRRYALRDVLEKDAGDEYYLDPSDFLLDASAVDIGHTRTWNYYKGAKREHRMSKDGHSYLYSEGAIPFPDDVNIPSRTMLRTEGNNNPNRMSHVIRDLESGKLRVLTPLESERLNGFEDNWTIDLPKRWRYFCMGNALVVGLVEQMGERLAMIDDEFGSGIMAGDGAE